MKRRILLGLTGSVATVLYTKLIKELQQLGTVDVILTEKAKHFVGMSSLCDALEEKGGVLYTEDKEWSWKRDGHLVNRWQKDDSVLHIDLRDRSSALVIAPCSANTMAKISNGLCDNLLTSVARAWDLNRPFIIAPAMNTHMWEHPITDEHIKKFLGFGKKNYVVYPQSKMLACKTKGMGGLANIDTIVHSVDNSLLWHWPFEYPMKWEEQPCGGIPVEGHPGSFHARRKNSIHTGVDLYANEGTKVFPVEYGVVVAVEPFTGPKDNSPWWLDTDCVLVEGASGVVCYGEIEPWVKVGGRVRLDTVIGTVKRVIPPDKPQHYELEGWKPSMLHMELYPHGFYKPSDGYGEAFDYLQDPTPYLRRALGAPTKEFKHVESH